MLVHHKLSCCHPRLFASVLLLIYHAFYSSESAVVSGAAFVPSARTHHPGSSTSSISGPASPRVSSGRDTATRTPNAPNAPASSSTCLRARSGPMSCKLVGIGSSSPHTVISNTDLEEVVETSDDWIRTRTGIGRRRVLLHEEKIRGLAVEAGRNALEMAEINAEDLDMVICATSTPDDMFGDAPSIAAMLGCTSHTVAFDITAACSGFLFGTVTAAKFMSAAHSGTNRVLVIGADALSRWVDWDDRNSCILFGDAAGAMVLEANGAQEQHHHGVLGYAAHSNGHGYEDLSLGYVGRNRPVSTPGDGTVLSCGSYGKMTMNGKEVYKFATREVPTAIEEALEAAEITVDDVDWLLLHQANIRIMNVVADRLGIPQEKILSNLSEYGNTSAASIPLALDEMVRAGTVKKGDVIACAGFGAGLSWGAAILKWN